MEDTISSPDGDAASRQRIVFSKNPKTVTNSVRFARFLCASTIEVFGQRMCVCSSGRTYDGFQINHFIILCIINWLQHIHSGYFLIVQGASFLQ